MHPKSAALLAFCDAEAGADQSRRIARHLSTCEKCRLRLREIRGEKDDLAAGAASEAPTPPPSLAAVLSAMEAWRNGRASGVASELKRRLRCEIETYFGSFAILGMERPGAPAEDLLGRASGLFEVFLGPDAADAVKEDVLRGLDWAGSQREARP